MNISGKLLFIISLMILLRCTPQNNNSTPSIRDSINIIDSIIITDSLYIRDSVNIIDSLFIRDSVNIIDSVKCIPPKRIIKEIFPDTIIVDSVYHGSTDLGPYNLMDNIPYTNQEHKGTRWALPGYPHYAVFRFNSLVRIDSVSINTFGWDEGYTHSFAIYNFSDVLLKAETLPILYSGHCLDFYGSQLMLEITGGKNSWTDIGEIKLYSINN